MPSASTTTSAGSGSCRPRPCCPTAAPSAACRSPASSTRRPTAWTASSACGTRTSGWRARAAASAATGAICAPSAKRSARTARPRGVIPFIRVMDSLTLAISQGSLRRGSAAVYLPSRTRRSRSSSRSAARPAATRTARRPTCTTASWCPTSSCARSRRRAWSLRSPKDNAIVRQICARSLWIRILIARVETGEPYLVFSDHVNNARPEHHKLAGLEVQDLQPVQRDHAADRHGPSRQRSAPPCAACPR